MSLILGFALQTPITSFIGWIYILIHTPYRVGDRIRIGDATGDVIDVGYLDTTLWEFGGQYLSTDHPRQQRRFLMLPATKNNGDTARSYCENLADLYQHPWNWLPEDVTVYASDDDKEKGIIRVDVTFTLAPWAAARQGGEP